MLRGISGAQINCTVLCGCKEQTSFSASLFAPVFKTVKVADILYRMLDRWITIFVVTCKCAWWRRESLFVLPGTNVLLPVPLLVFNPTGSFCFGIRGNPGLSTLRVTWENSGATLFPYVFPEGGWKYDSETNLPVLKQKWSFWSCAWRNFFLPNTGIGKSWRYFSGPS